MSLKLESVQNKIFMACIRQSLSKEKFSKEDFTDYMLNKFNIRQRVGLLSTFYIFVFGRKWFKIWQM